jgi:hypothetical protein
MGIGTGTAKLPKFGRVEPYDPTSIFVELVCDRLHSADILRRRSLGSKAPHVAAKTREMGIFAPRGNLL